MRPTSLLTVRLAADQAQVSSSSPERRHGLFSCFVMKGLRGEADLDGTKRVTVSELHPYVRTRVSAEAQAMNRKQGPVLTGAGGDRVLRVLP